MSKPDPGDVALAKTLIYETTRANRERTPRAVFKRERTAVKTVTVKLTIPQADALIGAACEGIANHGDDDLGAWTRTERNCAERAVSSVIRAVLKVKDKLEEATGTA